MAGTFYSVEYARYRTLLQELFSDSSLCDFSGISCLSGNWLMCVYRYAELQTLPKDSYFATVIKSLLEFSYQGFFLIFLWYDSGFILSSSAFIWRPVFLQDFCGAQYISFVVSCSGCFSLGSHHEGPGSVSGQSVLEFLWIKLHWDKLFFSLFVLVVFHKCSIFIHFPVTSPALS